MRERGWRDPDARLLVLGLAILGFGFFALPFATDIVSIAMCFLVIGCGTALHHAPSSSLIARNFDAENRRGALGLYNASGDVGKLMFTGLFSLGIGFGITWQSISLSFGLTAFVAGLAVSLLARRIVQGGLAGETPSDLEKPAETGQPDKGWGVLDWPVFNRLLVVSSIDTAVQTVAIIFTPFLMLAKGLPLSIATGSAVVLLAGGVFGKAGCGFLAQRIGTFKAFMLIQGLTAAGLVAVTLAPVWIALTLLLPLGAVLQGSSSITYGHASNLIKPEKMARGFALLYAPGTFASVLGPIVFGWYADFQGIEMATILMALFVLLSLPPMVMLKCRDNVI